MEKSDKIVSSTSSFAEALMRRLMGKIIEIYSGDTGVTRQYSQDTVTMKEVIRGRLVGAEGELLIIEILDDNNISVNVVYINAWNIRSVIEPKNGYSITDIYKAEHERVRK